MRERHSDRRRRPGRPAAETPPERCNGRIVRHAGAALDVEPSDPARRGETVRCRRRSGLPRLVTGDFVVWEEDADGAGLITAAGRRRNAFVRRDASGRPRPAAANLDAVAVVCAAAPAPRPGLIDRYLVAAAPLEARLCVVLNKVDLLDAAGREGMDRMLAAYEELEIATARVSALSGEGLAGLERALAGRTAMLVGQSGVGKSSLVNRLAGREAAKTGALAAAGRGGAHTTTAATLIHLPAFDVIDSPGVREFGLGHVGAEQVLAGFPELAALAGRCRFRDCAHRSEPGCAVRAGAADGRIRPERLASYHRIMDDVGPPGR